MDVWINYRLGYEAREAALGHEFGHALGLAHTIARNCNLMAADGTQVDWFCSTKECTVPQKLDTKIMFFV
jgi:predicted Zn-dependent protease